MTIKVTSLRRITILLTLVTAGLSLTAQAATFKVGDPAPKLQPGKWIQGEPVKEIEKGKAYIVEFWATWCVPCRFAIPHLNEFHKKFKDKGLIVIGQDSMEQDEAGVEPFVKKMGDKMTYRVALDDKRTDPQGAMYKAWMEGAAQEGIPHAFLVDKKSIVVWIGHPMELNDKMIEAVLADKFDPKSFAEEQQKEQQAMAKVYEAFQKQDWPGTETALADAEKVLPAEQRSDLDRIRLAVLFTKKDYPAAYKMALRISDAQKEDVMFQNELAWRIANDKRIEQRDLNVAETIATRANEAAKGNDSAVLDTLARIKF